MSVRLTLTELEAATCTRLTRFLPLDFSCVTGKETSGLESRTISLFIYFAKCAGDTESQCFCLTFDSTSHEVGLDVKLTCRTGYFEWLINNVLERLVREIYLEFLSIDSHITCTSSDINTSHS